MIFPELRFEKEVVEADKTRIEASGSYTAGSEYPISSVKIKVSDYIDEQVFAADRPEKWILDIKHKFQADITAQNNVLKYQEGYTEKSITLDSGTYTLPALITEIQSKLNANSGFTYTLTLQDDQSIKIEWAEEGKVKILNRKTPLWEDLGFKDTLYTDVVSSTKLIGNPVRTLPVLIECEVTTTEVVVPPAVPQENTETLSMFAKVYSLATVNLLSDDSELEMIEPDIKKYVKKGRSTYMNIHLQAQRDIIEWLDRKGFVNLYLEKYTINDIYDKSEVSNWAKFRALELIYGGLSNAKDDIFKDKEMKYKKEANRARRRIIRLDVDKDGRPYAEDYILSNSIKMVRV